MEALRRLCATTTEIAPRVIISTMNSFGSKRKVRVIKVDDPDEQENAPEAPAKEAEPTRKYLHPASFPPPPESDADFSWLMPQTANCSLKM